MISWNGHGVVGFIRVHLGTLAILELNGPGRPKLPFDGGRQRERFHAFILPFWASFSPMLLIFTAATAAAAARTVAVIGNGWLLD